MASSSQIPLSARDAVAPARETVGESSFPGRKPMVRRLYNLTLRTRAFRTWQRRVFRYMLSMRGSPEAIALGAAIGIFVAFTPTVGFQMLIAAALATVFRANRLAAIVPVWITNPATIPFIFLFVYRVGTLVWWDGPPPEVVREYLMSLVVRLSMLEFYAFWEQFLELFRIGKDVLIPMFLGGAIVGAIFGLASYPFTLRFFQRFHNFREKRKARRRKRRAKLSR